MNGNSGHDSIVGKVARKWIRSQDWNVAVLSAVQIPEAKPGIPFLPRRSRETCKYKRGTAAAASPARKLDAQEGRQIKVVVIEENKDGTGRATVKDLYI